MNGYKINDNLYINCNNVDYVSFLNDKVKIHMNDNTSYYITPEQYKDIETKIPQSGGSGGGVDITANIKITGNKSDILGTTEHNKLCILSNTGDLSFKVVDKIEGGSEEEISTLSTQLPIAIQKACSARYNNNIYIFGGSSPKEYLKTIYKFNCINGGIERLNVTLPIALFDACCAIYNNYIYIFGGTTPGEHQRNIYRFNCIDETIVTLSVSLPQPITQFCCSICDDNIYIFGGYSYDSSINKIYMFNCTNETITLLNVTLPKSISQLFCSIYEDNIYVFGGYDNDKIYKFNCTNKTIVTLSTTLPNVLYGACCSRYADNIYIFGGISSSTVNTIYSFNCNNETIELLNITLPETMRYGCCNTYENNIYLLGGSYWNNKYIYDFSISFIELTTNNVLIYNANSKYSFDLITDQVTIPISKIYIGDSNNTAQLANAYLYDETKSAWVNVNTGEVLS